MPDHASRVLWLVLHHMLAAFAACATAADASILAIRLRMAARVGLAERAALVGQDLSLRSVQFGRR
jgi:hypothetical protein